MKTREQIEEEIREIRRNQEGLRQQGRHEEADHWDDVVWHLNWVLN